MYHFNNFYMSNSCGMKYTQTVVQPLSPSSFRTSLSSPAETLYPTPASPQLLATKSLLPVSD